MSYDNTHALLLFISLGIGPLDSRFNALILDDIQTRGLGEKVIGFLNNQLVAHLGIDQQQTAAGGHRNNRQLSIWTPGHTADHIIRLNCTDATARGNFPDYK